MSKKFYREKLFLPSILIKYVAREKVFSPMFIYCKMKCVYKNGIFYKKTYKQIAEEIGVSYSTIRNHMPILKKMGLVYEHSGNICLVGLQKLKNIISKEITYECRNDINLTNYPVFINKNMTYGEFREIIYTSNIAISTKQNRRNCTTWSITQNRNKKFVPQIYNYYNPVSIEYTSGICYFSRATAIRYRKKINKRGIASFGRVQLKLRIKNDYEYESIKYEIYHPEKLVRKKKGYFLSLPSDFRISGDYLDSCRYGSKEVSEILKQKTKDFEKNPVFLINITTTGNCTSSENKEAVYTYYFKYLNSDKLKEVVVNNKNKFGYIYKLITKSNKYNNIYINNSELQDIFTVVNNYYYSNIYSYRYTYSITKINKNNKLLRKNTSFLKKVK